MYVIGRTDVNGQISCRTNYEVEVIFRMNKEKCFSPLIKPINGIDYIE